MKYRITFQRRDGSLNAREASRKIAIEVHARDESEARAKAMADGDRIANVSKYYKITEVRVM